MLGGVVRRALMGKVKESSGIPNAREVLIEAYKKSLDDVKAMPEDYPYRQRVEPYLLNRLKVVEEERDAEGIEARLGVGPIKDIIAEARMEHLLIDCLIARKPWVEHALHKLGEQVCSKYWALIVSETYCQYIREKVPFCTRHGLYEEPPFESSLRCYNRLRKLKALERAKTSGSPSLLEP